MICRSVLPLLIAAVQLCAAVVALGWPDAGLVLVFWGGGWPTATEALDTTRLLVWAIVLGCVGWSATIVFKETSKALAAAQRRYEVAVLVVGLLILAAGAVHHGAYQLEMSGGSVQEAQAALDR